MAIFNDFNDKDGNPKGKVDDHEDMANSSKKKVDYTNDRDNNPKGNIDYTNDRDNNPKGNIDDTKKKVDAQKELEDEIAREEEEINKKLEDIKKEEEDLKKKLGDIQREKDVIDSQSGDANEKVSAINKKAESINKKLDDIKKKKEKIKARIEAIKKLKSFKILKFIVNFKQKSKVLIILMMILAYFFSSYIPYVIGKFQFINVPEYVKDGKSYAFSDAGAYVRVGNRVVNGGISVYPRFKITAFYVLPDVVVEKDIFDCDLLKFECFAYPNNLFTQEELTFNGSIDQLVIDVTEGVLRELNKLQSYDVTVSTGSDVALSDFSIFDANGLELEHYPVDNDPRLHLRGVHLDYGRFKVNDSLDLSRIYVHIHKELDPNEELQVNVGGLVSSRVKFDLNSSRFENCPVQGTHE